MLSKNELPNLNFQLIVSEERWPQWLQETQVEMSNKGPLPFL